MRNRRLPASSFVIKGDLMTDERCHFLIKLCLAFAVCFESTQGIKLHVINKRRNGTLIV